MRSWPLGLVGLALLLGWHVCSVWSQGVGLSNRRLRWLRLPLVVQRLDTLYVSPGSFRVVGPGWAVDSVGVGLDSASCVVLYRVPEGRFGDSVLVEYRVLPLAYDAYYPVARLRGVRWSGEGRVAASGGGFRDAWSRGTSPFTLRGYALRESSLTPQAEAPSAGRMDLTLEGALGDGVRVRGELIHQNMPFQPDGTTVEVRALDRIYLQVASPRWQVEAGDIVGQGRGSFLVYSRPLQGLQMGYASASGKGVDSLSLSLAAGVAKGVYMRTQVHPQDGVQGPYRLSGHRGYAQSVVLAGSERVYLNGELLVRGLDRDYTVDYNLGEIRFTARRPVRRRDRIVVEYQQLDRHFMRLLSMGSVEAQLGGGWRVGVRGFAQHDVVSSMRGVVDAGQALRALEGLAAGVDEAWVLPRMPALDGKGGYALRDTLWGGEVYAYYTYRRSNGVDSLYEVPFTYVGPGLGEYVLTQGEANAPVYEWVGPSGKGRGEYRAGQRVRPPISQQVVEINLGKNWREGVGKTSLSFAYSHRANNALVRVGRLQGMGLGVAHSEEVWRGENFTLESGGALRYTSPGFRGVDAFFSPEYNRSWGLRDTVEVGQWLEGGGWVSLRNAHGGGRVSAEWLRLGRERVWRATLREQHRWRYVESRHHFTYSHARRGAAGSFVQGGSEWGVPVGHWRYSAFAEGEGTLGGGDTRLAPYWRSGVRVELVDSARGQAMVEMAYRREYPNAYDTLVSRLAHQSVESVLQGRMRVGRGGHVAGSLTWRGGLSGTKGGGGDAQHALGTLSYVQSAWDERLQLHVDEELGTEQATAWQRHYVRVPYGQGQYVWVDANGDGVAQVDEFARAQFRDEANYVLQVVPSRMGVLALHHRLQSALRWSARAHQARIDSGTAWWARVDGELGMTTQRKRGDRRYGEVFVPFRRQSEVGAIEWFDLLRASVVVNRDAWPFSLGYEYQRSIGSLLLSQGRDGRSDAAHRLTLVTPSDYALQVRVGGERSVKRAVYPFRTAGSVSMRQFGIDGAVQWYRGDWDEGWQHEWRVGVRRMVLDGVSRPLVLQEYSYGARGALGGRWHASFSLRYAHLRQEGGAYSPLLYEATQGLLSGHNVVLDVDARWRVSRYVELGAHYSARSLGLARPIHAASVHVRANFQ